MKIINRLIGSLATLLLIICLFSGCSGTEVGNPEKGDPAPIINLNTFANDEELEHYLKDQYAAGALDGAIHGSFSLDGGPGAADDTGFSQTNVQEAGVDESDVVKTDGTYMYVSRETAVSVVDAGDPMSEISRLSIDGKVDSIYLYGSVLVVLYTPHGREGDDWNVIAPPTDALVGIPYWLPVKAVAGVGFYDISDPADPRSIKSVVFEGHLISSRLVDGRLHLVQQFLPDLPPLTLWHDGTEQGREQAVSSNREAIDGFTLEQLLPHFQVTGDDPGAPIDSRTVDSDSLYCPSSKDGGGTIATVVTFDLDDPAFNFDSIGVVADVHVLYASTEALYLLAHNVGRQKDSSGYVRKSAIQKFDLTAQTPQYQGGGWVDGWILNQFSLGEHLGVLRVATTTISSSGLANHIFCLQPAAGQLEIVGRLENLAPGENIYAARFMGDRGFLVTFVKVDPLFTIDLSNPARPRIAGELKVPGYADYIHPYGDNHLITIGKDVVATDTSTWYQGMQLSIFDITDFGHPILIHKTSIGDRGTESEALENHKAFTFWASQELLAIPVRFHEHPAAPVNPWEFGDNVFNGLFVYRTSVTDGFEFLGRMGDDAVPDLPYPYSAWMRGVFSGPKVYAVMPDQILSAQTDQIASTLQAFDLPAVP